MRLQKLNKLKLETEAKLIEAQNEFKNVTTPEDKKWCYDKITQIQGGLIYINSKIIIEQNKIIIKLLENKNEKNITN